MRILFFFGGRLLDGRGTPSRVRNLAAGLADLPGLRVVAVSRDRSEDVASALGLQHVAIEGDPASVLRQTVEGFRPRIVYGHTHKALRPLASLPPGPLRVADLHGHAAWEKLEQSERTLSRRLLGFVRMELEERRFAGRMDALTVVSDALRRRMARRRRPCLLLWGGVDPQLFTAPAAAGRERAVTVAYAGNFRPYQGLGTLLTAAHQVLDTDPSFRFELIGDHEPFPSVAARARALGPRVTLHGQIPYSEVPRRLAAAEILAVPRPDSRTARYGFPSKLPEYLAMGRAVVATRVGEQGRVIVDGDNGLLVPPGSASALATAFLRLRDDTLRRRLGEAARRSATADFPWRRRAEELAGFLTALAGENPASPIEGLPVPETLG